MVWLGFGLLFSLLLGIAIWASLKSFTNFYEDGISQLTDDQYMVWSLMHPGWWLLPFVPVWGKKWLNKILDEDEKSLRLPFDKLDRSGSDVVGLKGGDCVLVSEYYERGSGLAHGVRLIPVRENSILKSGKDLQPNEISVYTARPLKREWAVLEHSGDTFELRARKKDYVISIIEAGNNRVQLCPFYQSYRLKPGDRFTIDITEFQFLQLPYLALVEDSGEIVCRDIEAGYASKSDKFPFFEIDGGKLIALVSDNILLASVKDDTRSVFKSLKQDVLLQPGDRLQVNDSQILYIGYVKG